jgi:hypothetical protein
MNQESSVNRVPHCWLGNMGSVPTRGCIFLPLPSLILTLTRSSPQSGRLSLRGKTAELGAAYPPPSRKPVLLHGVKIMYGIKFMFVFYWFCKIVWPKLVAEWVSSLLRILRSSGSNPDMDIGDRLWDLSWFSSIPPGKSIYYLNSCQHCFFPHKSQYIFRSTIWCYGIAQSLQRLATGWTAEGYVFESR